MVEDPSKNLSTFFMAMFISKPEEERKIAQSLFAEDYACQVDVGFEKEYNIEV